MSELIEKLRNPPVMSMALNRAHLSTMHFEIMQRAADRIEELEAENKLLREALSPFSNEAAKWQGYHDNEPLVEDWPKGVVSDLEVSHLRVAAATLKGQDDE